MQESIKSLNKVRQEPPPIYERTQNIYSATMSSTNVRFLTLFLVVLLVLLFSVCLGFLIGQHSSQPNTQESTNEYKRIFDSLAMTSTTPTTTRKFVPPEIIYYTIILSHYGSYVAKFYLYWTEPEYTEDGIIYNKKEWDGNGVGRTSGFRDVINIRQGSHSIRVEAYGCTGIAWQWWNTILKDGNVPLVRSREFQTKGTTLNQRIIINPAL